jgi:hypothetical protein
VVRNRVRGERSNGTERAPLARGREPIAPQVEQEAPEREQETRGVGDLSETNRLLGVIANNTRPRRTNSEGNPAGLM